MNKAISTALIKMREIKHPSSGDVIGFRLQAAVPNMAGRDRKGQSIPSFRKPYLISETSDYSTIGDAEVNRFIKELKFQNFNDFEILRASVSK